MEGTTWTFVFLSYWGSKYVLAAIGIWLGTHHLASGKFERQKPSYYDYRPFLARHPLAGIGAYSAAMMFILFLLSWEKPGEITTYRLVLSALAPAFYTWTAIALTIVFGAAALYLYSLRQTRIAGALSFASIMTLAFVAPFYYPF